MTNNHFGRFRGDLWTRRLGAFAVAAVAAYASYQHQHSFALTGGADPNTARLWPLSVDGLIVISTAGLLRNDQRPTGRARSILRISFAAGIIVSLAANIATAPSMTWAPILVAGWPPVALLLAVEVVGHQRERDATIQAERNANITTETCPRPGNAIPPVGSRRSRQTAEQVMWDHYQHRLSVGLPPPTGVELDHIAQTNNYGRAVLRKWRRTGRTAQSLNGRCGELRTSGPDAGPLAPTG